MLIVFEFYLVDALEEIAKTMGSKYWKFDADSCEVEMAGLTSVPPTTSEHSVTCECKDGDNSDCHVVRMYNYRIFPLEIFS